MTEQPAELSAARARLGQLAHDLGVLSDRTLLSDREDYAARLAERADELVDDCETYATRLFKAEDVLRRLHNEVDCRIEHGAESGGHLEYVRDQLDAYLRSEGVDDSEPHWNSPEAQERLRKFKAGGYDLLDERLK